MHVIYADSFRACSADKQGPGTYASLSLECLGYEDIELEGKCTMETQQQGSGRDAERIV